MEQPPSPHQALYIIDGISYPRHKNLIDSIIRNEPRLLSNTSDAIKARKWLRNKILKTDKEPAGWIGHLWSISISMENIERDNYTQKWDNLGLRAREQKISKIIRLIDELIESLEDDELPNKPVKATDLFDSWGFFYCMNNINRIHAFAKVEQKKLMFEESITDLLHTLKNGYKSMEKFSYGRNLDNRPNRGNLKIRRLANELAAYLMKHYQPRQKPRETIAALLSVHFPGVPITSDMVGEWIS